MTIAAADDPTGWTTFRSLTGIITDALPDMAKNHDKYLYGAPEK